MSSSHKTLGNFIRIASAILVGIAIYGELKKPAEEREWHGKIASFIPYDFRLPTMERLRSRLWNPEDPRIFTEHVFGVGWAINFYTVLRKLQALQKEKTPSSSEEPD